MAKIIIGIHGRSNKPEETTLAEGWKRAILEGLTKNGLTEPGFDLDFKLAYYRHIFYRAQLPNEDYTYEEATKLQRYKPNLWQRAREKARDIADDNADWLYKTLGLISGTANLVYSELFEDLGKYLNDQNIRRNTQNTLVSLLQQHRNDEIMLIAHSMGAIVAYDVLRELGRLPINDPIPVQRFVTIGSPLGLPPVEGENLKNHGRLRTPSLVVRSWTNFSDPGDFVCFDTRLADDYDPNSSDVKVRDILVANDYPGNPHKSYGYLRTPEMSEYIDTFL